MCNAVGRLGGVALPYVAWVLVQKSVVAGLVAGALWCLMCALIALCLPRDGNLLPPGETLTDAQYAYVHAREARRTGGVVGDTRGGGGGGTGALGRGSGRGARGAGAGGGGGGGGGSGGGGRKGGGFLARFGKGRNGGRHGRSKYARVGTTENDGLEAGQPTSDEEQAAFERQLEEEFALELANLGDLEPEDDDDPAWFQAAKGPASGSSGAGGGGGGGAGPSAQLANVYVSQQDVERGRGAAAVAGGKDAAAGLELPPHPDVAQVRAALAQAGDPPDPDVVIALATRLKATAALGASSMAPEEHDAVMDECVRLRLMARKLRKTKRLSQQQQQQQG